MSTLWRGALLALCLAGCEPSRPSPPTSSQASSEPARPAPQIKPLLALATIEQEAERFGALFAQVPNARAALAPVFVGERPLTLTLIASRPRGVVEPHQHQFRAGAELFGCLKDPANGQGPWSGARYFGPCALARPLVLYLDSPRRFATPKLKACQDRCCEFEPITQHINSAVKLKRVCYHEATPGLAPELRSLDVYGYW